MSQKENEDPIDFNERIRLLMMKVNPTMSVKNRENIAATQFLSGINDPVIAQKLLAFGIMIIGSWWIELQQWRRLRAQLNIRASAKRRTSIVRLFHCSRTNDTVPVGQKRKLKLTA